jgi:hypothetical protein
MLINIKKAPLTIWSGALLKQVTKKSVTYLVLLSV